jgi:hypothetical protein
LGLHKNPNEYEINYIAYAKEKGTPFNRNKDEKCTNIGLGLQK